MSNYEINCTLECQARCINCNRLCNIYPNRKDEITIEQAEEFVSSAQNIPGGIGKVKLLGGEPLLHSKFKEIFETLYRGVRSDTIQCIKLDSNHIIPFPDYVQNLHKVRLMGKTFKKKKHLWICNPEDLGYKLGAKPNCEMIKRCGISLDNRGYLPCSQAIMIVRLFKMEHLYKKTMPTQPWGLDEICPKCPFAMDKEWQENHTFDINHTPEQYKKPSKSYMEAICAQDH